MVNNTWEIHEIILAVIFGAVALWNGLHAGLTSGKESENYRDWAMIFFVIGIIATLAFAHSPIPSACRPA